MSHAGKPLVQLSAALRMIMSLVAIECMVNYKPAAEGRAMTSYGRRIIWKGFATRGRHIPDISSGKMADGMDTALWVVKVKQAQMHTMKDLKVNFEKLMPQSGGCVRLLSSAIIQVCCRLRKRFVERLMCSPCCCGTNCPRRCTF